MRFYILDDVVDPVTGENLSVVPTQVSRREGPSEPKCQHWCGYRGRIPAEVTLDDCRECQNLWIASGDLVGAKSRYPIVEGIPRLLPQAAGENLPKATLSRKTQESFGYEWEHFDHVLPEYDVEARNYFGIVPAQTLDGALVLDAGCGMGRWALHLSRQPIRRLYAVDFSRAIDRAAARLDSSGNAHCLQADICHLPFRPQTFDFSYCLGVLHHLENPDEGMNDLVRTLKRTGSLLLYLYYALDNRPLFFRWLFTVVTVTRWLTSRLPKSMMYALSWLIGLGVYWPLARLAGLLEGLGLDRAAKNVPLYHYRRRSLKFMVADAFDRFATPLERRYSRSEIRDWLAQYGLKSTFSETSSCWVVLGSEARVE